MKTTTFLLFASFLVASSFLSTSCSSIDLSTPIAAWSGVDAPAGAPSPAVHGNTVGVSQLSQSLLSLLGLASPASPALFGAFESAPELVVFFIEPALTTHNFYQLTGAFDASPSPAQPAYATVRKMLEGKTSTLLENVELFADLSSVVGALATRQLTAHITSTAVLVNGDDDVAVQALRAAFPQRVQRVAAGQLADYLREHPRLCANGVTDVVVYRFDAASSPAEHDAAVASVTAAVASMSKDVVYFFGSQQNPEVTIDTAPMPRIVRAADPNEPNQPLPPKVYSSLFPPGIFSGLITAAFLVIVLLIGICCICYSQTPDRFPEAVREGQVNHHILYPSKQ